MSYAARARALIEAQSEPQPVTPPDYEINEKNEISPPPASRPPRQSDGARFQLVLAQVRGMTDDQLKTFGDEIVWPSKTIDAGDRGLNEAVYLKVFRERWEAERRIAA